eukprot:4926256-Amphidinium_carterae.1
MDFNILACCASCFLLYMCARVGASCVTHFLLHPCRVSCWPCLGFVEALLQTECASVTAGVKITEETANSVNEAALPTQEIKSLYSSCLTLDNLNLLAQGIDELVDQKQKQASVLTIG